MIGKISKTHTVEHTAIFNSKTYLNITAEVIQAIKVLLDKTPKDSLNHDIILNMKISYTEHGIE